jgi:CRP-like cAMP-binding protein
VALNQDDIWRLKRLNFFPELTPEQKAFVEERAETLQYKKDEVIYFPGQFANYVYVVQQGYVRLMRQTPKGSFLTLDTLGRKSRCS